MISKLNNFIRNFILLVGGAIVIYNIIDGAREKVAPEEEKTTVLAKEFDDIW